MEPVQTFTSGREAKEYLIARILVEADREGTPLSETERKMMYFTETAWTLPDMLKVNEVFERDYDASAYEAKIGKPARIAEGRAEQTNGLAKWKEAVRTLEREDHYVLVLLTASTEGPDSPESSNSRLVDRVKLIGTALLVCLLLLAGLFLFD